MDTISLNFEVLKKDHWSEQETQNARLLLDFIQLLMNNHDFENVLKRFGNDQYRQHNRNIPDGFPALVDYVRAFAKQYPDYAYDVKRIQTDGDEVTFHSHVTTRKKDRGNDKKGLNIIDTWKVVDGQIVEHWDAIQPLDAFMRFYIFMAGGKIRNSNGVF